MKRRNSSIGWLGPLALALVACGANLPPVTLADTAPRQQPAPPGPIVGRPVPDLPKDLGPLRPLHVQRIEKLVATSDSYDTDILIQLLDAEVHLLSAEREHPADHPTILWLKRRIELVEAAAAEVVSPSVDLVRLRFYVGIRFRWIGPPEVEPFEGPPERRLQLMEAKRWRQFWERLVNAFPPWWMDHLKSTLSSKLESLAMSEAELRKNPDWPAIHPLRKRYTSLLEQSREQIAYLGAVDCEAVRRDLDLRIAYWSGHRDAVYRNGAEPALEDHARLDGLVIYRATFEKYVECGQANEEPADFGSP
jgi:hypothetical protein